MGIISKTVSRLSTLFAGAPASEVKAVNDALRGVAMQSMIVDDIEPATQPTYRPNRKARRARAKAFNQRTRNTKFSQRSARKTPKAIHDTANDKAYQFACHPVQWALLARGGFNRKVEGVAA